MSDKDRLDAMLTRVNRAWMKYTVAPLQSEVESLRKENERLTEAVDVAQEATKFARLDRDMYKAEVERLRKMVSLFAYCEDNGTRAKFREEFRVQPRAALWGETE